MAKRKSSKVSALPATPPQTVGEVLLDQAFSEITDQQRGDFVAFLFDSRRAKWSEKRKREVTDAMLQFANLGWAYYNHRTCQDAAVRKFGLGLLQPSDVPRAMKSCPQCGGELAEVPRHSKWLNDDQYAASKAGDWYCPTCPSNDRGHQAYCYWWDHELEAHERRQCEAITRV